MPENISNLFYFNLKLKFKLFFIQYISYFIRTNYIIINIHSRIDD